MKFINFFWRYFTWKYWKSELIIFANNIGNEVRETKEAAEIVRKYMKGEKISSEENIALKEQFYDIIKAAGIGVPFALIPGASFLLPMTVKVAKKYNINILPSSFIEKRNMMKLKENTWITSDTHYNHTNLCRGVTRWPIDTPDKLEQVRDFETLEEMNIALIKNINELVKPDDTLIHCGDWSFGGFEMIEKFRSLINCKNIILILGNHDHHIKRNKDNVRDHFILVCENLEVETHDGNKFYIQHYPPTNNTWPGKEDGVLMIHGHQHLKGDKIFTGPGRMDVGICGSPEFRPYHISEIAPLLKGASTSF